MLRHTHATEATKAPGFDLRLLQESMGHESLDTTGRYMHVQPGKGSADFLRPIRRTPPPPLAGVAAEIRNSNG
jgi:integrase